jgi:hypothetical protein
MRHRLTSDPQGSYYVRVRVSSGRDHLSFSKTKSSTSAPRGATWRPARPRRRCHDSKTSGSRARSVSAATGGRRGLAAAPSRERGCAARSFPFSVCGVCRGSPARVWCPS